MISCFVWFTSILLFFFSYISPFQTWNPFQEMQKWSSVPVMKWSKKYFMSKCSYFCVNVEFIQLFDEQRWMELSQFCNFEIQVCFFLCKVQKFSYFKVIHILCFDQIYALQSWFSSTSLLAKAPLSRTALMSFKLKILSWTVSVI